MRPYDSGYNVRPSPVAFRGFKPFIVSAPFHLLQKVTMPLQVSQRP